MKVARIIGIVFILLGAWFAADGLRSEPPRWLSVLAGALFIYAGALRLMRRGPGAKPPA